MLSLIQWNKSTIFLAAVIVVIVYALSLAIYRLFLSPLANFPGPRIAALTRKYETYYEINRYFEYHWKIKKMHMKYGPIVRISPHEIHIDDPDFFNSVNSFSGKWDKDPFTVHQFGNPGALIGTKDHDIHRKRRLAIFPFFSKQKIYDLEPVIQNMATKLCEKLQPYIKSRELVNLRYAFKAFAADTTAEYCFSENGQLMDKPNFNKAAFDTHRLGGAAAMRARYFPKWLLYLFLGAPSWIKDSIDPAMKQFGVWHTAMNRQIERIDEKKNEQMESEHRTIFHEVINSPDLPAEEKTIGRLVQEAAALVGPAGESTSQVLAAIAYHVVADPKILKKLRDELHTIIPDANSPMPSLKQLERLPYLTGCCKEGLRLRTGKIARHQRVPSDRPLRYGNWDIPAGTSVSMTPIFQHLDPNIYPDPHAFKPERWVNLQELEFKRKDHYLVPYSKGFRGCVAVTLANALLYIAITNIFVRFDLELFDTNARDTETAVDTEHNYPKGDSKGVRVFVNSSKF